MHKSHRQPAGKINFACAVLAAVLGLASGCISLQNRPDANAPLSLKVAGTKIIDSKGEPVWLRGVNAASMEWTSDGQGHILNTVNAAIHRSEEHTSELQSLRHLVCRLLLE